MTDAPRTQYDDLAGDPLRASIREKSGWLSAQRPDVNGNLPGLDVFGRRLTSTVETSAPPAEPAVEPEAPSLRPDPSQGVQGTGNAPDDLDDPLTRIRRAAARHNL